MSPSELTKYILDNAHLGNETIAHLVCVKMNFRLGTARQIVTNVLGD